MHLPLRRTLLACAVTTTAAVASLAGATSSQAASLRPVPDPLYGITMDRVDKTKRITDATSHLSRFPTTRIVFDEWQPATDYATAVSAIRPTSFIMGELLDSYYVKKYSVAQYRDRVAEYETTLGTNVDIWEVGNEVNGEWLGATADVVAKISDAYDQTKARGYRTALTLYYNPNCWSKKSNEMFTWAGANIPDRMKSGLDYVLVSYYEQDCNNRKPTVAQWQAVFDQLHGMFPNSRLGFGEVGTHPKSSLSYKTDTMQRYYGMPITTPNYVGGYFWWYGFQDLTPWTKKPLWKTLNAELQTY